MILRLSLLLAIWHGVDAATGSLSKFYPGQQWNDTQGNRISARGAGFLHVDGTYYWFGQFSETFDQRNNAISAYASTDLYNWDFKGIVFRSSDITMKPPDGTTLYMERPKVVQSPTGDFVMHFKLMASPGSVIRQLGVAQAPSPTEHYKFEQGVYPAGEDMGDVTVYDNRPHIADRAQLVGDAQPEYVVAFTGLLRTPEARVTVAPLDLPGIDNTTGTGGCSAVHLRREGEALFYDTPSKHYVLVTSHTTGWQPNPSEWFVSPALCGPSANWTSLGDRAQGSPKTYGSQSTYALEYAAGKTILMMDHWNWKKGENLNTSTYVWLPVQTNTSDGWPQVYWMDSWNLNVWN